MASLFEQHAAAAGAAVPDQPPPIEQPPESLFDAQAAAQIPDVTPDVYPKRYRPNPTFVEFEKDRNDLNHYPRYSREGNPNRTPIEDYSQGNEYSFGDYASAVTRAAVEGVGQVAASIPEAGAQLLDVAKYAIGGEESDRQLDAAREKSIREMGMRSEIGYAIRQLTSRDPADVIPGFWTNDVPVALGQVAGFFAGGAIGAAVKVPAWITMGSLGAAVGGSGGYDDAVQNGATPDEAAMSYWINSAAGITEAIPLAGALNKLNKYSGGRLSGFLNREFEDIVVRRNLKGKIAADIAVTTIEEALQETFQEFILNSTAQDWVGYDPDRELSENLVEAGTIGGTVGFMLQTVASALGIKLRKSPIKTLEEQYQEYRREQAKNPNAPENIGGEFTELPPTYLEFMQKVSDAYTRLDAEAGQADVDVENTLAAANRSFADFSKWLTNNVKYGLGLQLSQLHDPENVQHLFDMPVKIDGEDNTLRGHILSGKKGAHVLGFSDFTIEDDLFVADSMSPERQADIVKRANELLSKLRSGMTGLGNAFQQMFQVLEGAEAPILILTDKAPWADHRAYSAQTAVRADGTILPEAPNTYGLLPGDRLVQINQLKSDVVKSALFAAAVSESKGNLQERDIAVGRLYESMFHEMAHSLLSWKLGQWVAAAAVGVPPRTAAEARQQKLGESFLAQYRRYAARIFTGDYTFEEWMLSQMPSLQVDRKHWRRTDGTIRNITSYVPEAVQEGTVRPDAIITPGTKIGGSDFQTYWANPHEWFAQTVAKMIVEGRPGQGETQIFFPKETSETFREIAEGMKRIYDQAPPELLVSSSFRDLMGTLSAEGRIKKMRDKYSRVTKTLSSVLASLNPEQREQFAGFQTELDLYNEFVRYGATLPQLGWLNPHIEELQAYINEVGAWDAYRKKMEASANNLISRWKKLGKEEANRLSNLLIQETLSKKWAPPETFGGWSTEATEVYKAVHAHFNQILDEMEATVVAQTMKNYKDATIAGPKVAEVRKSFDDMRKRPYFPLMRFGKYAIEVRDIKTDKVEEYYMVDSKRERKKLLAELRSGRDSATKSVAAREVKEKEMVSQGLPYRFISALEESFAASGKPLSSDQVKMMKDLQWDYLPSKSFLRSFRQRRGISGFSFDGMRILATYTMNAAGYLARARHGVNMQDHIKDLRRNASMINLYASDQQKDMSRREQIANHLQRHYEYIMEPSNEWAQLRSLGFLYYLGYNLKSAVVNMTQVPFVTYPHLAAKFGDTNALKAIASASKQAMDFYLRPNKVTKDVKNLIAQGQAEGWLDESLATELAISATHGTIERMLPFNWAESKKLGRHFYYKLAEYGAIPFHRVEKLNRNISAIARYNLARAEGVGHSLAVQQAKETVQKTQFEYSRWARAELMRGKKGALFLFKSYVQGTLFFLYNDPGAWRYMAILALVGGLQGLPFADDLLDLLDLGGTELKKRLGMPNERVDLRTQLREDLRELADALHTHPDVFLRGISSQSMGLGLLNGMGIPMPQLDISGSISQGNIIPLTDLFRRKDAENVEELVGRGVEDIGGALGSMFAGLASPFVRNDPDTWRRLERALPLFLRGPSKAVRLGLRGVEETVGGEPIAEFDPDDPIDAAELAFQTFGFTPRRISRGWEERIAALSAMSYWDARKHHMLQQYNYAAEVKDREAKADALKAIKEYNKNVPYTQMRISSADVKRSLRSYIIRRRKMERGLAIKSDYQRLRQDYAAAYAESQMGGTPGKEVDSRPLPYSPSSQ